MPFASAVDVDIYWKLEGEADRPTLVLLNSIGTDIGLWEAALPPLRREFSVLRVDTRGHGASDAPSGDYQLSNLAADVLGAMDAAGVGSAAVAGVSLGGMIAMQLALDAPERVIGMALVCTSATMDRDAWRTRVERVRRGGMPAIVDLAMDRFLSPAFAEKRPEVAATVRRGLLDADPDGYAGCAAAIRDMDVGDRLGGIRCPVLVVTGTLDVSTPFEGHGEHLVDHIGGARHVALVTAHLAPLEAPDELARVMIEMFATAVEPLISEGRE